MNGTHMSSLPSSFDDSTGKGKIADAQQRSGLILKVFGLGVCLGLIIAERVYLTSNRQDILQGTPQSQAFVTQQDNQDHSLDALHAYLEKVAPQKEVLIGVSNRNPLYEGMLDTFLKGVQQAEVTNYLIVALDKETETTLAGRGINVFYMPIQISKLQQDTGSNHAVSALKFGIIKKFLKLGWAVLLSDIDVCVLQNPFNNLYRCATD